MIGAARKLACSALLFAGLCLLGVLLSLLLQLALLGNGALVIRLLGVECLRIMLQQRRVGALRLQSAPQGW
jgi:UPF0716 family protein affecting phage T7 exclusion